MRGGKREGAGRPAVERPTPVSWRPKSFPAREAYHSLGGAEWLDRVIEQAITSRALRVGKAARALRRDNPALTLEDAMQQAEAATPWTEK